MKITKFIFLFSSLVSASYCPRETPDKSIIVPEYGIDSETYSNGLLKVNNDDIRLLFMGDAPAFIDHLHHLNRSGQNLVVRDDAQHNKFIETLRSKIDEYENDRGNLYVKTLKAHDLLNKEQNRRNSTLTRIYDQINDNDSLERLYNDIYNDNLNNLELLGPIL